MATGRIAKRCGIVVAAVALGLGPARVLWGEPSAASGPSGDGRPNVLMIAIDDLNDWVGCLGGHPQVQTPHIDRLAARGTLFTNAHCQAPLCNPSRTSLMTGLRPSTTGVYGLSPWVRNLERFEDHVTLPRHMAAHGYRTYSAGKVYHGRYGSRGDDPEFQVYGPPRRVRAKPKEKLVETPNPHRLVDWGHFEHRDRDKGDWKVASWAVDQLEKDRDKPFFMCVGFFLPHVPLYATQKWFDRYPAESVMLPAAPLDDRADTPRFSWYLHWKLPEPRLDFLRRANQWRNLVRSYLACTSFVDSQVGRVLEALRRGGHAENTVVVLWSDHGWHLGSKRVTGKNTLWDPSTRVPLIFAGPGVSEGARSHEAVELLDIYPTLIDLLDLEKKQGLEGLSLVPQLRHANAPRKRPAITTHNPGNHAVRTERWRYIRYADGSEELYDMRADPHELDNLAGASEHRDVIRRLRKWLPDESAPHAPGSRARILRYDGERAVWQGEPIAPDAPIPGVAE